MEILFILVPVFIVGVFLFILIQVARQVGEWADNNSRPVLSVPARVVTKRSDTSGGGTSNAPSHVSTSYYATFELESGERVEFSLYGKDYGMIAEGDQGTLTYQGTRYHGFHRGSQAIRPA